MLRVEAALHILNSRHLLVAVADERLEARSVAEIPHLQLAVRASGYQAPSHVVKSHRGDFGGSVNARKLKTHGAGGDIPDAHDGSKVARHSLHEVGIEQRARNARHVRVAAALLARS